MNKEIKEVGRDNNSDDDDYYYNYKAASLDSYDHVIISIEEMLKKVGIIDQNAFIYKVSKGQRKMNESMFTPYVISIGPFHYGRPELKAAEKYKLWALKRFLRRVHMSVKEAMNTMLYAYNDISARRCYGGRIHMNKQDFAKLMLLDACFIIEFTLAQIREVNQLWRYSGIHVVNFIDNLYQAQDYTYYFLTTTSINFDLQRDLTLVENQLPFFVLKNLFELVISKKSIQLENHDDMMRILASLYKDGYGRSFSFKVIEVRHLLDLLRMFYVPSHESEEYERFINKRGDTYYIEFQTITELCEAGVEVYPEYDAKSVMDFKFKNGHLSIPPIKINSNYEIHIQNLIVSEMVRSGGSHHDAFVFHYLSLLADLIKTEKDVSILKKKKIIITNQTVSDQEVVQLINNLRRNVPTLDSIFYYYHMKNDIDEYCKKWQTQFMASRHRYMAILRRDYFNTPWALISFLAATFLLILTFLQTLFSSPYIFHK